MDEKEAEARPLMGTIFLVYVNRVFIAHLNSCQLALLVGTIEKMPTFLLRKY